MDTVRYGSGSVRAAMTGCTQSTCLMYPANMMHYMDGVCMFGFNQKCGAINPATGKEVCCSIRELPSIYGRSAWDFFVAWNSNQDNSVEIKKFLGAQEHVGYTIRPNTFTIPRAGVSILDSMSAPLDTPFPHPALKLSDIFNIVFQAVPTKPLEVHITNDFIPGSYAYNNECGRQNIFLSTGMSMFYYDTPTRMWVSIPLQGDEQTGYFSYNRTSSVGTALIHPRVAIRNELSIFVVLVMGIPILGSGDHLNATFVLPPTGLRKSDLYKQGRGMTVVDVGCNFLLPVRASLIERMIWSQSVSQTVIGAPGSLQNLLQTGVPDSGYQVSLFVDPNLLSQIFASSSGGRRQAVGASGGDPVKVYFSNSSNINAGSTVWIPIPPGICNFNTLTSSSVCTLNAAFFAVYGFNLTLVNAAPASSKVSVVLLQDEARATLLQSTDYPALQRIFDGVASTTAPSTTTVQSTARSTTTILPSTTAVQSTARSTTTTLPSTTAVQSTARSTTTVKGAALVTTSRSTTPGPIVARVTTAAISVVSSTPVPLTTEGLSVIAILGIVFGSIVGVIIVGILVIACVMKSCAPSNAYESVPIVPYPMVFNPSNTTNIPMLNADMESFFKTPKHSLSNVTYT